MTDGEKIKVESETKFTPCPAVSYTHLDVYKRQIIMIAIACVLLYLAIVKKFEPLLLLPIAFGMLLSNLPMIKDSSAIMMHTEFFTNPEYMTDGKYINVGYICQHGGLLDLLYLGVKLGIYPPLIFVGIGCMTAVSYTHLFGR